MKLNPEVKNRTSISIKNKIGNQSCLMCGSTQVGIIDEIILAEKSSGGKFPMIVTGCLNCGYIMSFGANTLVPGIFPNKANKF